MQNLSFDNVSLQSLTWTWMICCFEQTDTSLCPAVSYLPLFCVSVRCVRVQDRHASQAGSSPGNPQRQPSLHLRRVRKGLQAAEPDEEPPDHPCRASAIRSRDLVLQQDLRDVQANVCQQLSLIHI